MSLPLLLRKHKTYRIWHAKKVVDLFEEGKTIAEIGRTDGLPTAQTIYLWMAKEPEFAARMKAIELARLDMKIDEAEKIAATAPNEARSCDDSKIANAVVNGIKLQVETMHKTLAFKRPDLYGQKAMPLAVDQSVHVTVVNYADQKPALPVIDVVPA